MMKKSVAAALEGGTCRARAQRYNTGREGGPPQNGFLIILLECKRRKGDANLNSSPIVPDDLYWPA
jgi:hypothetical protein